MNLNLEKEVHSPFQYLYQHKKGGIMDEKSVLIVDDEKNIRLAISRALETEDLEVDTAINGEGALKKLEEKNYNVIILDIKMPGMSGIELLKELSKERPEINVIILTAHGTVESAVEAMKVGAVDFLQKPISAKEIREIVRKVIDRKKIKEKEARDYESFIELAKRNIHEGNYDRAIEWLKKAVNLKPEKPETFNLIGSIYEIKGNRMKARKNYRTALSMDATFKPAKKNLNRLSQDKKGDLL